jgi:hypothetical protein
VRLAVPEAKGLDYFEQPRPPGAVNRYRSPAGVWRGGWRRRILAIKRRKRAAATVTLDEFNQAPASGPPPGEQYGTIGYGLFRPFVVKNVK